MDNHKKEIINAKITTLQESIQDPVIQTVCNLLLDIVKLIESNEGVGFKNE